MRIFVGFKENDSDLAFNIKNLYGKRIYPIFWPKKRNLKVKDLNLFPNDVGQKSDYYLHYSGYQKISPELLNLFINRAFNLHPAPPWYRGSGGLNLAIYRMEKKFGITLHHMSEKYDDGKIIKFYDFELITNENIINASKRINIFREDVFREILSTICKTQDNRDPFPFSINQIKWEGELFKISDIDDLSNINLIENDIPFNELNNRIKAFATNDFPVSLKTRYGSYKIFSS